MNIQSSFRRAQLQGRIWRRKTWAQSSAIAGLSDAGQLRAMVIQVRGAAASPFMTTGEPRLAGLMSKRQGEPWWSAATTGAAAQPPAGRYVVRKR